MWSILRRLLRLERGGPAKLLGAAGLAACLTLAACATDNPGMAATGLPLRDLPAQRLERGQCGVFLWERGDEPRLIMLITGDPRIARVHFYRDIVDFPLTRFAGDQVGGFYPEQTFEKYGVTLRLSLTMTTPATVQDGFLVPAGSLEYVSESGWSLVVPVAGLAACER